MHVSFTFTFFYVEYMFHIFHTFVEWFSKSVHILPTIPRIFKRFLMGGARFARELSAGSLFLVPLFRLQLKRVLMGLISGLTWVLMGFINMIYVSWFFMKNKKYQNWLVRRAIELIFSSFCIIFSGGSFLKHIHFS